MVRMTPVAVLVLAPRPLISCRIPMGISYPRDLWMAMNQITRPSGSLYEPRGRCSRTSTFTTLLVRAHRAGNVPVPWPDAFQSTLHVMALDKDAALVVR